MSKLKDQHYIDNKIFENTLQTCHYVSGEAVPGNLVKLHCIKHDLFFETQYDNVRKATRAHLICPACKEEVASKNKVACVCDYCGKEFLRTKAKVKSTFNFCSRTCKDAAQCLASGETFDTMRPGHYGQGNGEFSYRQKAFENFEHQCANCGWNEDPDILEVHHIDENRQNNALTNLVILCPTCHRKLSSHKYLLNLKTKKIYKK